MRKQMFRKTTALSLIVAILLSLITMTALAYDADEYFVELQEQTSENPIIAVYENSPTSVPDLSMAVDDSEFEAEILDESNLASTSRRANVSDLEGGTELNVDARETSDLHSAFSASDIVPAFGDFYASVNGFLTQTGAWSYLIFDVFPGEILHLQLDTPHSASIDYDLFLYRMVGNFMMSVASSELRTFINADGSTLSETIGFVNFTPSIQTLVIVVESIVGSSATMPFTLHVAANMGFELFEVDSIAQPRIFDLGNDVVREGVIDTRADNDWFRVVVSENRDFDTINIALDTASVNSGHVAELYRVINGRAQRVPITDGVAPVVTGNHYIRIHNRNMPLTGVAYQLTITTNQQIVEPFEPSISLDTTLTVVETGEGFEVFGYADIEATSLIAISLYHNGNYFALNPSIITIYTSGRFSFGWFNFGEGASLGVYTFTVALINSEWVEVATASTQLEVIAPTPPPPPPPPPPVVVARVDGLSFTPSDPSVRYSGVPFPQTRIRIRQQDPIRVRGRALDASGVPVANVELQLTFVNEGWHTSNPAMRYTNRVVETNATGHFDVVINLRSSAGALTYHLGHSIHTFDTGQFRITNVESGSSVTVPTSHQNIFILANSRRV